MNIIMRFLINGLVLLVIDWASRLHHDQILRYSPAGGFYIINHELAG